jgi:hypothetical protein
MDKLEPCPNPAAVGDMVLVPREPTEAMVEAGMTAPWLGRSDDTVRFAYRAIIAAAQPPLCPRTLEAAANRMKQRADELAHEPRPEFEDHRQFEAGRQAEANHAAFLILALGKDDSNG